MKYSWFTLFCYFQVYSTVIHIYTYEYIYSFSDSFSSCVLVTQSCLTLCDPTDYNPLGSSVPGILQARILDWVAIPFSRGSSWPRDGTRMSCIAGSFFTIWATGMSQSFSLNYYKIEYSSLCYTGGPCWLSILYRVVHIS